LKYLASEKLEIIRTTIEIPPLPVRRTLARSGIPKSKFYILGATVLQPAASRDEDGKPRPRRVWNRIGEEVRRKVIALAA
jgi:putative transposase